MSVTTVKGTAVAVGDRGLLILGASGSGKSTLALDLMALGAALIADDAVILRRDGDRLMAACPPPIRGLIEARGIGLLHAVPGPETPIAALLHLDRTEEARLPAERRETLLGITLPALHKPSTGLFPAAILQYLKEGRRQP